jgi:hypothetical protein
MLRTFFPIILLIVTIFQLSAQSGEPTILIQPYLQDATPNSIKIAWETSFGEESLVEYGSTPKLEKKAKGVAFDINFSSARIHEVKIEDLERFTDYYYRVRTGKAVSDIFQFKTPPFASDHQSFNMVAMSDMQIDHNNPDKWSEVVNDGLLQYLKKEMKGKLPDNLALVLLPGDLVENGTNYGQWRNDFFNPAEKLFSQVPVYPVLGNHEKNSIFYFKYFSLPENGTPAYAEHWWYKDYGNTRVIGLNSNEGYRDLKEQYDWLEKVLDATTKKQDIDFVFAQLHHPHKSELWIPGEEESSGKVVQLLEKFSTESGKPSIHFFGHTHGYSRGQSKDHKHLWINVASAGGAIDNWGEFEGISRGNANAARDNEMTDSITIWKRNRKPKIPETLYPKNQAVDTMGVLLKAGKFNSSATGAFHAASHWQVSTFKDFSSLEFESWKQFENWYYLENRQKNDDLTDERTERLDDKTVFFWRVRYRDQNLNWSDWSKVATFRTKER